MPFETAWRRLFVGFLIGGYILAPNPVWALVFYVALAPLSVWGLIRGHIRRPPMNGVVVIGMVVIGWFWMSLVWGSDQPVRQIVKYVGAGPSNLVFFLTGVSFFTTADVAWRRRFACGLALAGGANALVSILGYLHAHPSGARLTGYAETRHSILGAAVLSIAALHALHLFAGSSRWRERFLWGACVALAFTFVGLSGSRGPAISLGLATLAMTGLRRRRIAVAMLTAAMVSVGAAWYIDGFREWALDSLARPSLRPEIWRDTLTLVSQKPLLGYGVGSQRLLSADNATFPHSIYLSALFYGGAVGLVLLLALLASAIRRALKLPDRRDRALCAGLLLVPIVNGITDIGQAIKPPEAIWYILWVPLMIAAGTGTRSDIRPK